MKRLVIFIMILSTLPIIAQENWGPAEYIDSENWWDSGCGGEQGYGFLLPSISSNDSLLFMEFWCFDTSGIGFMRYEDGDWADFTLLSAEIQALLPSSPFFTDHNDSVLYFSSSNYDEGYGQTDIWATRLENGIWSTPWNLGSVINSEGYEHSPSITDDGNRLFFVTGGQIVFSDIIDGEFSEPQVLPEWINSQLDEYDPRISGDGERLYFTRGDFDPRVPVLLMVSRRSGESWGEPLPLNSNINFGGGCEFMPDFSCAPSFSMDGTKMYFSHFEFPQPWCEPNFRIAVSYLETAVEDGELIAPESFSISVYPNPFNSRTVIHVQGNLSRIEDISIYDITGRKVRSWPINNEIVWDGNNADGIPVASGVYLIKVGNDKTIILEKTTLLK
ncbi:MAG: T9SS type A sorting domain-containing protein [candidate division Zixibacteria bacterium]